MAGRKKHSAEDVVRKLRRADELAASGKTNEEIAGELEVSAATLHNWRRTYGGMDVDAAKELKELREQNTRERRQRHRPPTSRRFRLIDPYQALPRRPDDLARDCHRSGLFVEIGQAEPE